MWFIFQTPELIRNLWQLKTAVFLHWCLICAVPLSTDDGNVFIVQGTGVKSFVVLALGSRSLPPSHCQK